MTPSLFIILFTLAFDGVGQPPQRIHLDDRLEPTAPKKATHYRVHEGMDGEVHVGRTYAMDGRVKVEGRYLDESLTIPHGAFVFYHANGRVESKGTYVNGYKSGLWQRFDQWGEELAEKIYDPEPLANIVYTRASTMPAYAGGEKAFIKYLKEEGIADGNGRGKRILTTSFIVEKSGQVSDVKIIDAPDHDLEEKVSQAIGRSTWSPGVEHGQPVRVRMRIPVQF